MIGQPRLGARAIWIAAATAVLVAQVALAVGALVNKIETDRRTVNLGCNVGPVNVAIDLDPTSTAFTFPYGKVTACQVLHKKGHLFGEVEATTYLLLDTDKGAVAVRVEYRGLKDGWQWTARAYEVTADEAADLLSSEDDRQRIRAGIDRRGGVRAEMWQLHYGDG